MPRETYRDVSDAERFGVGMRCATRECTHVPSVVRMVQYEVAGRTQTMFYYLCADHDPRRHGGKA